MRLLPTPTVADSRGTRNATAGRTGSGHHDGWTLSDVAHADRWGQYSPAIRRWETVLGRPAPEPTVTGKRGGQRLSGRFTEWLMGLPDGWVSDLVDNNAAVRICGNGVVPQQALAAYFELSREAS
jgi:DNA (cytosine-5)-methyltransferase 1